MNYFAFDIQNKKHTNQMFRPQFIFSETEKKTAVVLNNFAINLEKRINKQIMALFSLLFIRWLLSFLFKMCTLVLSCFRWSAELATS